MKGRKIRKLTALSNVCKVLGVLHCIAFILMVLNVDGVALVGLPVYLLKMVLLLIATVAFGIGYMEADARREELTGNGIMRNL